MKGTHKQTETSVLSFPQWSLKIRNEKYRTYLTKTTLFKLSYNAGIVALSLWQIKVKMWLKASDFQILICSPHISTDANCFLRYVLNLSILILIQFYCTFPGFPNITFLVKICQRYVPIGSITESNNYNFLHQCILSVE